jgi:hypothetical protein
VSRLDGLGVPAVGRVRDSMAGAIAGTLAAMGPPGGSMARRPVSPFFNFAPTSRLNGDDWPELGNLVRLPARGKWSILRHRKLRAKLLTLRVWRVSLAQGSAATRPDTDRGGQ